VRPNIKRFNPTCAAVGFRVSAFTVARHTRINLGVRPFYLYVVSRSYDMVKPQFLNLDIEMWTHHEKLGVSQLSLCLFHSSKQSGHQLLAALDEMQGEGWPSKRALTFRRTERRGSITTLQLLYVAEHADLRVMNIASDTNIATIQMTAIGHHIIHNGILNWLDGLEDFGVSVRDSQLKRGELGKLDIASGELWFWGPGYIGP
jgi:hypothetical protein